MSLSAWRLPLNPLVFQKAPSFCPSLCPVSQSLEPFRIKENNNPENNNIQRIVFSFPARVEEGQQTRYTVARGCAGVTAHYISFYSFFVPLHAF